MGDQTAQVQQSDRFESTCAIEEDTLPLISARPRGGLRLGVACTSSPPADATGQSVQLSVPMLWL